MAQPQRKYDKGENRRKHQGTAPEARIVHKHGQEIGQCPRGFSTEIAQQLLGDAIEEHKNRQPDVPFRLWSYHRGAVYQARTSDGGRTWHGWPVQGSRIPDKILSKLEAQAEKQGERDLLKQWLRRRF